MDWRYLPQTNGARPRRVSLLFALRTHHSAGHGCRKYLAVDYCPSLAKNVRVAHCNVAMSPSGTKNNKTPFHSFIYKKGPRRQVETTLLPHFLSVSHITAQRKQQMPSLPTTIQPHAPPVFIRSLVKSMGRPQWSFHLLRRWPRRPIRRPTDPQAGPSGRRSLLGGASRACRSLA